MISTRSAERRKAKRSNRTDLYRLVFGPAESSPQNLARMVEQPEYSRRIRDPFLSISDFKNDCRLLKQLLPECHFPPERQLKIVGYMNAARPKGARPMRWHADQHLDEPLFDDRDPEQTEEAA
jgi:hypothetical protein